MDSLWRAVFRMVNIFKKKRVIIPLVVLLVVVVSGSISFLALTQVAQKNVSDSKTENQKNTKPAATPKQASAPKSETPSLCRAQSALVEQLLEGQVKVMGSESKPEDGSDLTLCSYYKGSAMATVKVYVYPGDTEAEAASQKLVVGGYEMAVKGVNVVSVSVAKESGSDVPGTKTLLAAVLDKL